MNSKQQFIHVCIVLLLFVSCNKQKKEYEKSEKYLQNIHQLIDQKNYYEAKFKIDSLAIYFPEDHVVKEKGVAYLHEISILEKKHDLIFCDSLIIENRKEIDQFKSKFIYEKSAVAGLSGRYIHKSQTIEKTLNRSFIRGNVEDDGKFYISSHYCGVTNINHTQIKVSVGDLYVISSSVPFGGGFNMRYVDGMGKKREVVIYNQANDGGIFNFIAENVKSKLKVEFIGNYKYSVWITETDKKAIMEAQQFSQLLCERERLKKEELKIHLFLKITESMP